MTNLRPVAVIDDTVRDDPPGYVTVWITYPDAGVDRPQSHGYRCTPRNAVRLVRAVAAGVVLYEQEILTDIHGQTYVGDRSHVYGKRMNADLKRLGF